MDARRNNIEGLEDKRRRRDRLQLRKNVKQTLNHLRNASTRKHAGEERQNQLLESNVKRLKLSAEQDRSRAKAVEVLEKLVLAKQKGKSTKKKTNTALDDDDFDSSFLTKSARGAKVPSGDIDNDDF